MARDSTRARGIDGQSNLNLNSDLNLNSVLSQFEFDFVVHLKAICDPNVRWNSQGPG